MPHKTVFPGPNFKGYVKNFDRKRRVMKGTYHGLNFLKRIDEMAKELEDPSRIGMRKSSGKDVHIEGTEKLRKLGLDPIVELTNYLGYIEGLLKTEIESGTPRSKYITDLLSHKLRILEALLPYKYGKAPTKTIEDVDARQPIRIILDDTRSSDSVPGPDSRGSNGSIYKNVPRES